MGVGVAVRLGAMRRGASKMLCAAIAGVLAGCGGGAGSSTRTVDRPAADARPSLRPRDHEVGALQKAVFERLRVADPGAEGTDHVFDDAHTRARIAGDRVYIDIAGPDAPVPKKSRHTVRYAGNRGSPDRRGLRARLPGLKTVHPRVRLDTVCNTC